MKRAFIAVARASALMMVVLLALSGCDTSSPGTASVTISRPTATPTQPPNGGLPSDIPIYPGAQVVSNSSSAQPGQASFQAPASLEMVSSFYQQQMPQQGWKATQVQDNGADGVILAFSKDTRVAHIVISPGFQSGQVVILITLGNS